MRSAPVSRAWWIASCAALAATVPVVAEAAPSRGAGCRILKVRSAWHGVSEKRVVLELDRLPRQRTAQLVETPQGWRVDLCARSGDAGRAELLFGQKTQVKRTFFLRKAGRKRARLVVDFIAAETPVQLAEKPAASSPVADRTSQQQANEAHIAALFGLPAVAPAAGDGSLVSLSGYAEAEARWFARASDDGAIHRLFGSLAVEPTLRAALGEGHALSITGFGRIDTQTQARTHADLREAKFVGRFGAVDATVGVDRRFWGQLEAAHLVDIVNQIDTLEDIDGEDKLGQPLAELKWTGGAASLSVLALPYFRDRLFPDRQDRPNAPLRVTGKALRDGTSSHWTPDFAVRGTLTAGPVDLAVHVFDGLNREPRLLALPGGVTPVYDRMTQVGADALAVLGPLRLKAEGYHRGLRNDRLAAPQDYGAFGIGAEYTWAGAIGQGDLSALAEFYYDSRDRPDSGVFDRDVFAGFRYTGNDIASTELLGGLLVDTRRSSKVITLEASRRLADAFRLSLDVRMPVSVAADDPLRLLRDDGFVQLKLQYHF